MIREGSLDPRPFYHPSKGDEATRKVVEAIRTNAAEKEGTYQQSVDLTEVGRTPENIQAINEALASIDIWRISNFSCYFQCETGSDEEISNLKAFCCQLNLPTRVISTGIHTTNGKSSFSYGFVISDFRGLSFPDEFSTVEPSAKMLIQQILQTEESIKDYDKEVLLHSTLLDFSWVKPSEANGEVLGVVIDRMCYERKFSPFAVSINMSGWSPERINRFAQFFNRLPFPQNTSITVKQGWGVVDNRQVDFLRSVNHRNIRRVCLIDSSFSGQAFIEVVNCLVESSYTQIEFSRTNVLGLHSGVLMRHLPRLCRGEAEYVRLASLSCDENIKAFTEVNLNLLARLQAECGEVLIVFPETIYDDLHKELIEHYNRLSPSDQVLFARVYFRNILLGTEPFTGGTIGFSIDPSKRLAIANELKPLINAREWGGETFAELLGDSLKLPSAVAADFIRKRLEEGFCFTELDRYVSQQDQLDLLLLGCQHIPYYFFIAGRELKLTDPALPAPVRRIVDGFGKAINTATTDPDLSGDESDTEEQLEGVGTYFLPVLESVCSKELKQFPFLLELHKKIKATHQKGEEQTYPLLNMMSWFAWSCIHLILLQEKERTKELDAQDIAVMGRVFHELINFTNPMLRYKLSAEFFDVFFVQLSRNCLVNLVEDSSVVVVLPAISSVKMVAQGGYQPGELQKARELLGFLSSSQYDGHYFRTLVSGFHAIASEETVPVLHRFNMLLGLFAKSSERQEFEEATILAIDQFVRSFEEACRANNPRAQEVVLVKGASLTESQRGALKRERAARLEFVEAQVKQLVAQAQNRHVEVLFAEASLKSFEGFLPSTGNAKELAKKMVACERYLMRLLDSVSHVLYNEFEFKQRNSRFILVQGLSELGELKGLQEISSRGVAELLQRVFNINDVQASHYSDTFGRCYNQGALLTYYAKIRTLAGSPKGDQLLKVFRNFIFDVLSKDSAEFYERRYQIEPGSHAEHVFLGKHNLLKGWRLGSQENFLTFFNRKKIEIKDFVPDFKGFIIDKIFGHKHINPEHYTAVGRFLNNLDESHVAEAVNAVEDSKAAYEKDKEYSTQRKYIHARIQLLLINLCQEPVDTSLSISQRYRKHLVFLNKIRALLERYFPQAQFRHDVEVLYAATRNNKRIGSSEKSKWKNWTIVDTDNYWHTFMAGTVIDGSCQHVSTHVSTNKCLMAYVVDPKYRMIAILDEEGIPVARAMVRLLPDLEGSTNAIFLEEAYPDSLKPELQEALVEFAIERAQALDVMLVSYQGRPDSQTYEGTWTSLGSPTPWEYVDALSEVQEGSYTIVGGSILYEPNPSLRFTRKVGNVLDALSNHSEGSSKDEVISSTVTAVTPMLLKAKEHPESPHPVNPRRDEESAKRTAPEFG